MISTVTTLRTGEFGFLFQVKKYGSSILQNSKSGFGTQLMLYSNDSVFLFWGYMLGRELTTHLYLVPTIRMSEAIPLFMLICLALMTCTRKILLLTLSLHFVYLHLYLVETQ